MTTRDPRSPRGGGCRLDLTIAWAKTRSRAWSRFAARRRTRALITVWRRPSHVWPPRRDVTARGPLAKIVLLCGARHTGHEPAFFGRRDRDQSANAHYHFGSREDVLVAVIDAIAGRQAEQIGQLFDSEPDPVIAGSATGRPRSTGCGLRALWFELATYAMRHEPYAAQLAEVMVTRNARVHPALCEADDAGARARRLARLTSRSGGPDLRPADRRGPGRCRRSGAGSARMIQGETRSTPGRVEARPGPSIPVGGRFADPIQKETVREWDCGEQARIRPDEAPRETVQAMVTAHPAWKPVLL